MLGRLLGAALVVTLGSVSTAAAQDARARLEYARDASASACPEEEALRDAVGARLGYVPFHDDATRTVRVHVRRLGRRLVATIDVLEGETPSGAREIGAPMRSGACPLEDALVLAVSLAIDPMTLAAVDAPAAPVCPACEACGACPVCPVVAEAAPCPAIETLPARDAPLRARLSIAPVAAVAPLPFPTGALRIGAGLRVADFSLDVELRGDAPTTGGDADGTVSATWISLAMVPCGHVDVVALCGLVTTGALVGWGGGVDHPRTDASGFSTLGARAGLEIPLLDALALTVSADAAYVLTPTDLVVNGRTLHATAPVVASLGVGVVVEIL